MILYDKLTKVFDAHWFLLKYNGGTFSVKEDEGGASVKEIVFEYHGQLMNIHKDIFNKTDFLYKNDDETERGMPQLKHSCDGVLVIERKEERFIIFVELKSKYSEENISKAEKQLSAGYFRMMSLLSILDGVEYNRYKKCGIIVSHPIETERLTRILKKKNTKVGTLSRFERQCLQFSKKEPVSFPINRIYSQLPKLPVKGNLCFNELPTFHVKVNRDEEQERFNLDSILKQL